MQRRTSGHSYTTFARATNDYFEDYETVRFEKAFPGTYTMKMTDLPERRLLRFEVK